MAMLTLMLQMDTHRVAGLTPASLRWPTLSAAQRGCLQFIYF